jgi:hypothetical protein
LTDRPFKRIFPLATCFAFLRGYQQFTGYPFTAVGQLISQAAVGFSTYCEHTGAIYAFVT